MAAKKAVKKAAKKVKKAKSESTNQETNLIRRVTARAKNSNVATFSPGDTVNVFVKVKEGEKERVQSYKGIVTKLQGSGSTRAFTVRKISAGVGVERTFPFTSPSVERVELLTMGNVRRAKLYYLRGLEGKAAKIESTLVLSEVAEKATAEKTEA